MQPEDDHVERATTFNGSDAPAGERLDGYESKQNHYRRLSAKNSLRWRGQWRDEQRETRTDAAAILDSVAGHLELTPYQHGEAERIFSGLPDKYVQAYSTALVALCVCSLVARQDGRSYHPNQTKAGSSVSTEFTRLVDDIGTSYTALYKCWCAVQGEMS